MVSFPTFKQMDRKALIFRDLLHQFLQICTVCAFISVIELPRIPTYCPKEIILKHNKTFGGSLNDLETITQAGITRKTFYKYKKELLSEMAE